MVSRFRNPVPPYSRWERRLYRLSRPVTEEDVAVILHGQDEYYRTAGHDRVVGVHRFGLVEINVVVGVPEIEVWFSPEQRVWTSEYLDALFATRFRTARAAAPARGIKRMNGTMGSVQSVPTIPSDAFTTA